MLRSTSIYVAVLVTLFSHAVLSDDWTETKMYQGWQLGYEAGGSTTTFARNAAMCTAGCVLSYGRGCLATWYRPSDGTCRRINDDKVRMIRAEDEDLVMITQWSTAVFLKDDMTLVEAEDVCNVLGGRLMTLPEIRDYFDTGVSHCTCAWISGGNRVSMRQPGSADGACEEGVVDCYANVAVSKAWCRVNI